MPVVPMNRAPVKAKAPTRLADLREPPAEPFALMAAAQMHSEGRLLNPNAESEPTLGK